MRTEQSRPDCAVSIETCRHRHPLSCGRNGIGARPLMDDRGVAEADVYRRRPAHAFERTIECSEAIVCRRLWPRLHIGFVDLDDVGAGGKKVLISSLTASA